MADILSLHLGVGRVDNLTDHILGPLDALRVVDAHENLSKTNFDIKTIKVTSQIFFLRKFSSKSILKISTFVASLPL